MFAAFFRLLALLVAFGAAALPAQTILFSQNFNSLQLQPSVQETTFSNAFTHIPPPGWIVDRSDIPGVGTPSIGVEEWEGWSYANKAFWILAGQDRRPEFTRGQGIIAVADPDEWNDIGNPADNLGFYNTLMRTGNISLPITTSPRKLKLKFDSSWLDQCCDDGDKFNPNGNNKTARISLKIANGPTLEVLRWESAPYLDRLGKPSRDPQDDPNPFFKDDATNEGVILDLTSQLQQFAGTTFTMSFAMQNAGDDWWWAVDNVQMFSLSVLLGDMNVDGVLSATDIDAFALGLKSVDAYRNAYFGEFPVDRGSLDSVFDFDDIGWFVDLMDASGVPNAQAAVAAALQPVPEPSSVMIVFLSLGFLSAKRREKKKVERE